MPKVKDTIVKRLTEWATMMPGIPPEDTNTSEKVDAGSGEWISRSTQSWPIEGN
jgi:hypothetical protein